MARPTITFDDWLNKDGDRQEKMNWLKQFYLRRGVFGSLMNDDTFFNSVAQDFYNKNDRDVILKSWRSFKHVLKEKNQNRQYLKIYLPPKSSQKFKRIQKRLLLSQGALIEKLIEDADSYLKVLDACQKIERFLEANKDSDDVRQLCNDLKKTLNGVERLGDRFSRNFLGVNSF